MEPHTVSEVMAVNTFAEYVQNIQANKDVTTESNTSSKQKINFTEYEFQVHANKVHAFSFQQHEASARCLRQYVRYKIERDIPDTFYICNLVRALCFHATITLTALATPNRTRPSPIYTCKSRLLTF